MAAADEMSRIPKAEDVKIEYLSDETEDQDRYTKKEQRSINRRIDWRLSE